MKEAESSVRAHVLGAVRDRFRIKNTDGDGTLGNSEGEEITG